MPPPRRPAPPPPPPQQPPPPPDTLSPAAAGAAAGAAATLAAMPVVLGPAAAAGAAAGVGATAVEQAIRGLVAGFAAFMRQRSASVFPVAMGTMRDADPEMDLPTARRLAGIELEYEAEYQRKALERITADLRLALSNPDAQAREEAIRRLLERERRFQRQREEAIAVRALARAEANVLKRASPRGAFWMLSDYVREHTPDCLAMAGRFWPWEVLEREGPPRHHGCPCYLIGLDEAKGLGLMTDGDVPDTADAIRRARRLLDDLEEARHEAALAVGLAAYRVRSTAYTLSEASLVGHAKRELARAGLLSKDSDYEGMVGKAVLRLVKQMAGQGHSGMSASMVIDLFRRLANYEPLTPLTSDPAEWIDRSEMSERPLWQSDRNPSAFSEDGGKTYTLLDDDSTDTVYTSEPPALSMQEAAYSLEEAPGRRRSRGLRGTRKRYDKRYSKGTTKGGEFRPERGGSPGRPTLAGVTGRGQRLLGRSPALDRARGRWVVIDGHPVRVPEGGWSRKVNGVTYTSPAGGTNVYREGTLVSEPGVEPAHRALVAPAKRTPGSTVTDVPADRVLDALGALDDLIARRRDPVRRAIRDRLQLGQPPVEQGAGPEAIEALRAEGFTMGAVGPGRWVNMHHAKGKLRLRYDGDALVEVRWMPHEVVTRRPRGLRRPPNDWDEMARDALHLADELGEQYGAEVRVPRVLVDAELADHAGRHEWNGVAMVGRDAPRDIEAAAAARRDGRALDDFEARGVYASAWVLAHEVAHGVNPIDEELFESGDANLEEALAEEVSHPIALARLRRQGQPDVVKWALMNPDALPVAGVYLPERGALADLLDRAGIVEPERRLDFLMDLKFRVAPAERMAVLADALVGSGDFETWDLAYDHVVGTMDSRDMPPRSALEPGMVANLAAPKSIGLPADVGTAWQVSRKEFAPFPEGRGDPVAALRAFADEHGADSTGRPEDVRRSVIEALRPPGVSPEAPWVPMVLDEVEVPESMTRMVEEVRRRIMAVEEGYGDPAFRKRIDAAVAREKEWSRSVELALSYGLLTPAEARDRGYYLNNGASEENFGPLPERMWHVTVAKNAVLADGRLRSRQELAQDRGHGLGAGADNTVSFTSSREVADAIRDAILEGRQVARGEITARELLAAAERGDRAEEPFIHDIVRAHGNPDWVPGDPYPPGLEALLRGMHYAHHGEIQHKGFAPTVDELNAQFGKDGWWSLSEPMDVPAGLVVLGTVYVRSDPERERDDRFDLFKKFLFFREHRGGPIDPLFMSTDVGALANTKPDDIGILEVEPIDDAHGHDLGGVLREWRTWTGAITRVVAVDDVPLTDRKPDPIWSTAAPASPGAPEDTPQMKAALRSNATARKVRARFPAGTRVEGVSGAGGEGSGRFGTVERHIPQTNAQGGSLIVRWDNGEVGRHSPVSLRVASAPPASPGTGNERVAALGFRSPEDAARELRARAQVRPFYREMSYPDLLKTRDTVRRTLARVERDRPDDHEELRKRRRQIEELTTEIELMRRAAKAQREMQARAESQRTGILAITGEERRELLSRTGDVYRDAGVVGPNLPRPGYRPDLFVRSDLSGRMVRYYVTLPDGRKAHPDELHEALQRGRIIVAADLPRPPGERRHLSDLLEPADREYLERLNVGSRYQLRDKYDGSFVMFDRALNREAPVPPDRDNAMALRDALNAPGRPDRPAGDAPEAPAGPSPEAPASQAPESPGAPLMRDRNGAQINVGDPVLIAGTAGGTDDTGIAIATSGRRLRYVSDRVDDPLDREREVPTVRATAVIRRRAARSWDPRVEPIRQLDEQTALIAQQALNGDGEAEWEIARELGDLPEGDPLAVALRQAFPELEAVRPEVYEDIEAPVAALPSPSHPAPRRVDPALHGPGIGVRYERSPDGLTTAEALGDHYYGDRSTGHFGTGVYFLSGSSDEAGMEHMDPEVRTLVGVDLQGARLHRPHTTDEAFELHDTLRLVNDLAHYGGEELTIGRVRPRLHTVASIAARLPAGADGVLDVDRAETAVRQAVAGARSDREADNLDADTAATRVMRALGFEGVDVRHLPDMDNAVYGSVVYRPVMSDGGIGRDHMIDRAEAERWTADAPEGGWAGIVYHTTAPATASAIEASGFDFDRIRSDGGAGRLRQAWAVWFSDEPASPQMYGAGVVKAAVRLNRVATDDDVAAIREDIEARYGALPTADTYHIMREALLAEGFDGYRGVGGAVGVLDPESVRVVEPDPPAMERRGDGAVVSGRRGRWVWISGMYRHIPEGEDFTETVGDVSFISPANSTFVYRKARNATDADFPIGSKVIDRNLDDNGWRTGTVTGARDGMVYVTWDGQAVGAIMPMRSIGVLVSKPRWNNHIDVRDPRYGGTTRAEGSTTTTRRQRRRRDRTPPESAQLALARRMFPVGARVRLRRRTGTPTHGEVTEVRENGEGVEVRIEWAPGGTSGWRPAEIETVPSLDQPDWRDGQRVITRASEVANDQRIIEGVLTRRPGRAMVVTDDDGRAWVTSMEALRPIVPELGSRVRAWPENEQAWEGEVIAVENDMVTVDLPNGDAVMLHAGRVDVLEPPRRNPDMGVLLDDDVRARLVTMSVPVTADPVEVAPGVWFHPNSPEVAHGHKLPDRIVLGPSFFDLGAGDRDYHLMRANGFGLAEAMAQDEREWQEAQNIWTADGFSARTRNIGADARRSAAGSESRRHLDRYSLHAAIATGYARLSPPDLDQLEGDKLAFPDALRIIALAAERHGYPVEADTLDWAHGRNTGGIDPDQTSNPAAEFVRDHLRGVEGLNARHQPLIDAGFTQGYSGTPAAARRYERVTSEGLQTIELDSDGEVLRAVTQSRSATPSELERQLEGRSYDSARVILDQAGWTSSRYGSGFVTYVSPDLQQAISIQGNRGYGVTDPLNHIWSGPASLDDQAGALRARASVTSAALIEALRTGVHERVVRAGTRRNWTVEHDEDGWLTLRSIVNPNTPDVTVEEVRMHFTAGPFGGERTLREFGYPNAGDSGLRPSADAEYQARVGAAAATLRREYEAREARRLALVEQIRERVAAGREPFDGTESYADVKDALSRMGFDGGSTPRELRNGGLSVTHKNRRNGAKIIVRLAPSTDGNDRRFGEAVDRRTVTANSRVDAGRMVGERQRTRGRMPADRAAFVNDILGRSDELASHYGTDSVTSAVRFNAGHSEPQGMSGHHGWDGTIVLGTAAWPAIERAIAAKAAGRPLTNIECESVYAAYKLMQHEIIHGVRGRRAGLRYDEHGSQGFEEALTEELAHVEMRDWLRSHNLDEVVAWGDAHPNHHSVRGTYQHFRTKFREALDVAGVADDERERLALMQRWSFQTDSGARMEQMVGMIAQAQGIGREAARTRMTDLLRGASRGVGSHSVMGFRPVLSNGLERDGSRRPAAPYVGTVTTSTGDELVVGDTFEGVLTGGGGTITEITPDHVTWTTDDGRTITRPASVVHQASWRRTSIAVRNGRLRVGDRFRRPNASNGAVLVEFTPDGRPRYRPDDGTDVFSATREAAAGWGREDGGTATTVTVRTVGGDQIGVGDTFKRSATGREFLILGIDTNAEGRPTRLRYRPWGTPTSDGDEMVGELTGEPMGWVRTSMDVNGARLRVGQRFRATHGTGTIIDFDPDGSPRVRWDDSPHVRTYSQANAREARWRPFEDAGGSTAPGASVDLGPLGGGVVRVGAEVLIPNRPRARMPYLRGTIAEITPAGIRVEFPTGGHRVYAPAAASGEGWMTPRAAQNQLRPGTRVEVTGSRGKFTGVVRRRNGNGSIMVRRDGASRGASYDIHAIRKLEPEPGPGPGPGPGPATATARITGGGSRGTVGVGARMRGASTGRLITVTGIESDGRIRFRRDDGTSGTYGGDQFKAIVITDEGVELKNGDIVSGPGLPNGGAIEDIDWTRPAEPRVKVLGLWHPARPLRPAQRRAGGVVDETWLTAAGRRGQAIAAGRGDRVLLNDGTVAELLEREMIGTWPDRRPGAVRVRGVSGPRINAAFTIQAGDIAGLPSDPPRVPTTWGSTETRTLLTRLGDQHYRRVRTAKGTAELLGAQVGAPMAEDLKRWWQANEMPTRRVQGEERAVVAGKSVRYPDLVGHLYGVVFAGENSMNALRDNDRKAYDLLEGIAEDASLPWPNWRERIRPSPPVRVPAGTMFEEAVLRATWTGTFGRRGYRTEVTDISGAGPNSTRASVSGTIYDEHGTVIGHFSRSVSTMSDGSPTVYHASMSITRAAQGSGFAKAFNRHAESVYRVKGVKRVTVTANIDVGGYAWAATGFDFNVDSYNNMTPLERAKARHDQARGLLEGARRSGRITRAQYDSVIDKFLPSGARVTRPEQLEGKVTHAWELAFLGEDHSIGKRILLGQSWGGIKWLVGPDRSPFAG